MILFSHFNFRHPDGQKLVAVRVYERMDYTRAWAYGGMFTMSEDEFNKFQGVIQVGSEGNPVGAEYEFSEGAEVPS